MSRKYTRVFKTQIDLMTRVKQFRSNKNNSKIIILIQIFN